MPKVRLGLAVLVLLVLVPAAAFAQASITGVVRDTSGAVMPGVTVEASSPVLIEKSREAVTDSSGLYRIVDLRPGTYTITFGLTGFTTVRPSATPVFCFSSDPRSSPDSTVEEPSCSPTCGATSAGETS